VLSVGDIVTYADRENDENPPRGRLVLREPDQLGERVWVVEWEQPDGRKQRLKTPERSLRPLHPG
jgi:hypothetical protein